MAILILNELARPTPLPAATHPSRCGGWRGLLMGGLFAAALASIFGVGALASVLGFLLQFALIVGVAYLVVMFIRSRNQPALARAKPRGPYQTRQRDGLRRQALGSTGGAVRSAAAPKIARNDLDAFERLLGDIQTASAGATSTNSVR